MVYATTLIHSSVVEAASAPIVLWYAARALDWKGRGYGIIRVDEIAKELKCAPSTIRSYIRTGFNLGYFHHIKKVSPKVYKVSYVALVKLAYRLGLSDLGAITEVTLSDLQHLKRVSRMAHALARQQQSHYAAIAADINNGINKQEVKRRQYNTANMIRRLGHIFKSRPVVPSQILGGGLKSQKPKKPTSKNPAKMLRREEDLDIGLRYISNRYIYIDPDKIISHGVGQPTIASTAGKGRATSTIQRSLSPLQNARYNARNKSKKLKYRKKPLAPLQRRQIAHVLPHNVVSARLLMGEGKGKVWLASNVTDKVAQQRKTQHLKRNRKKLVTVVKGTTSLGFEASTNLYDDSRLTIFSKRSLRRRFNRYKQLANQLTANIKKVSQCQIPSAMIFSEEAGNTFLYLHCLKSICNTCIY